MTKERAEKGMGWELKGERDKGRERKNAGEKRPWRWRRKRWGRKEEWTPQLGLMRYTLFPGSLFPAESLNPTTLSLLYERSFLCPRPSAFASEKANDSYPNIVVLLERQGKSLFSLCRCKPYVQWICAAIFTGTIKGQHSAQRHLRGQKDRRGWDLFLLMFITFTFFPASATLSLSLYVPTPISFAPARGSRGNMFTQRCIRFFSTLRAMATVNPPYLRFSQKRQHGAVAVARRYLQSFATLKTRTLAAGTVKR